MRKVILNLAVSLDGMLADAGGGVAWLEAKPAPSDAADFSAFLDTVDTVMMGGVTYRQIRDELFPSGWPYAGKITYVLTRSPQPDQPEIKFTEQLLPLLEQLRNQEGKDIWICGGAETAGLLLDHDLIDEIRLTIMPVLLGSGLSLWKDLHAAHNLTLKSSRAAGSWLEVVYITE